MMKHLKRTGREEKKNYSYQKNVENSPHRHCKPGKRKKRHNHTSSVSHFKGKKEKKKKGEKQNNKSK